MEDIFLVEIDFFSIRASGGRTPTGKSMLRAGVKGACVNLRTESLLGSWFRGLGAARISESRAAKCDTN